MTSVAVIGAGLSGLVVARALRARHTVTVFEKSRYPGGRLASREAGPWLFDHGAQFFVRRGRAAQSILDAMSDAGAVGSWNARFCEFDGPTITTRRQWSSDYPHYVGLPAMRSVGRWLAKDLRVVTNSAVNQVVAQGRRWRLDDAAGQVLGTFDWVIAAAPGPQSVELIAHESLAARSDGQPPMRACNVLMLGFEQPPPLDWQAALVRNADISWMSVNSSKPGRNEPFSMVVLSTNAWADAHLHWQNDRVVEFLLEETARIAGIDSRAAVHVALKRWRYANVARQSTPPCFVDAERRLGACGDWFVQGRIEGAVASAEALATELLAQV